MSKERTSVRIKGDLKFAQSAETVDLNTPDEQAIRGELLDAEDTMEMIREELEEAYAAENQRLIAHWEKKAARHQERLQQLREEVAELDGELWNPDDSTGGRPMNLGQAMRSGELVDYIFQDGTENLWAAFKNFLAVVRKVAPHYLGGMTQTQVAILLGEKKATVSAREIRMVEELLIRWGVKGFLCLGGSKSVASREKFAAAAKGNTNRRGGGSREKAQKIAETGKRKPEKSQAARVRKARAVVRKGGPVR